MDSHTNDTSLFDSYRRVFRILGDYDLKGAFASIARHVVAAILQLFSVFSIFAFLALASDPDAMGNTKLIGALNQVGIALEWPAAITLLGLIFVILTILNHVTRLWAVHKGDVFLRNFHARLRVKLFRRVFDNDINYFATADFSQVQKVFLTDLNSFVYHVVRSAIDLAVALIGAFLLILACLLVAPAIAVLAIATTLVVFYLLDKLLRQLLAPNSQEINDLYRELHTVVRQSLNDCRYVLVQGAQEYFSNRLDLAGKRVAEVEPRILLLNSVPKAVFECFVVAGIVLSICILIYNQVSLDKIIPILGVALFATYRLLPSLQTIFSSSNRMHIYHHALESVEQTLVGVAESCNKRHAGQLDIREREVKPGNIISIEKIHFAHVGEPEYLLTDVNLDLKRGEHIGFCGPTGGGKSTLMDILMLLQTPNAGRILNDSVEIGRRDGNSWRSYIGYVPQEIILVHGNFIENIAFADSTEAADLHRIREAARFAGINDFIERQGSGYQTIVGERGTRLSGGQRQRVGIARALYRNPEILLLDEATSALDVETESSIMDLIGNLKKDLFIVSIAHRPTTLSHCDKVYEVLNSTVRLKKV